MIAQYLNKVCIDIVHTISTDIAAGQRLDVRNKSMAGRESRYARGRSWCDLRPNAECERRRRADRSQHGRRTSTVLLATLIKDNSPARRPARGRCWSSTLSVHRSRVSSAHTVSSLILAGAMRSIKNDPVRTAFCCDVTSVTTAR